MAFEPWMLRTGLVLVAMISVNTMLLLIAERQLEPEVGAAPQVRVPSGLRMVARYASCVLAEAEQDAAS
jgi:hypothetical protein